MVQRASGILRAPGLGFDPQPNTLKLEVLLCVIKQEKETRYDDWTGRKKLSLIKDDIIIYAENLRKRQY